MAIYTLPSMVNRIAGSRKGCTFQKSGVNYSIRTRRVPTQKRTAAQSVQKNYFDRIQKQTKTLSPTDQVNFETASSLFPRTDSLGNTYNMSVAQFQSGANINNNNATLPEITSTTPPNPDPSEIISSASSVYSSKHIQVLWNSPAPLIPYGWKVFMSIPNQNVGIAFDRATAILVNSNKGITTGMDVINGDYSHTYMSSSSCIGLYVWYCLVYFDIATGQEYPPSIVQGQIT